MAKGVLSHDRWVSSKGCGFVEVEEILIFKGLLEFS